MFKLLELPYVNERFIGFSNIIENAILTLDVNLCINKIVFLEKDQFQIIHDEDLPVYESDDFDYDESILTYANTKYDIMGLTYVNMKIPDGCRNAKLESQYGESLKLHPTEDYFEVYSSNKQEVLTKIDFDDLSKDWRCISFSPDDQYIFLGLAYDLYIYKRF